jgi:hypothetical protein
LKKISIESIDMPGKFQMRITLITLFISVLCARSVAQELNCTVNVLSPTIQLTNKEIFKNLEIQIKDFMNNRHWTNDNFSAGERIDCNLQITINSYSGNDYSATLQIVSSRPVYGTNYNSTLFNFLDKNFNFNYKQFQILEYQENSYSNELTAVLSYYAYIILGYDYESFSKYGGQQFFVKAQNIVNSAQSSSSTGWSAMEKDDHNRYFLANDMLDERAKPFREAFYKYHRLGMDFMSEDNEKALDRINESLNEISEAKKNYLSPFLIYLFLNAKSNELIDLFAQSPTEKRAKAKDLLVVLDPLNTEKYNDKLK